MIAGERPGRGSFLKVRAPSSLSDAGRSASDRSGRSFRNHLCILQLSRQVHSGTAGALAVTYNCECLLLRPRLALRIKLACTSLRKGQSFVTMLSLDWFPLQPYQIMAVFGETRPENCLRSSRIGPNEDDRRGTWL